MEIRFAENKDTAGILTLLKQVGGLHHSIRPDLFREKACKYGPSQLFSLMESSDTPIFVAVEEDKVLGYGFCKTISHKNDSVLTDVTSLYIDDLCVDEDHRGKGIGKAIYQEILRYAQQGNYYNLTLNVWNCNTSAMKFYESLGLKPQKIHLETILEEK